MKVCFLLERGSPPRLNPILAEVFTLLERGGIAVTARSGAPVHRRAGQRGYGIDGIENLACITPAIGAGLWRRSERPGAPPLNVIACENLPGAGAYLRHQVLSALPPERTLTVDSVGGFSAGTTRRIMTGRAIVRGEVRVTIDGPGALVIDTQGLKAPLPPVQGVTYTPEFSVLVLRKLFTLNCAHAVAAYLGYREGCRFIHEAAVHPRVAPVLRGALAEAQAALTAEFPHHGAAIAREAAEALAQIANARLADSISRVARAPRRKLSLRERLLGPARLARRHHLPHEHLCVAIAATLAYDDPTDAQAVALQEAIAAEGLDKVLTEDCGLLPYEDLARAIKRQWLRLRRSQVKGGRDEGLFPVRERVPPALQSHPGRGLHPVGARRHRGYGPVSRGGAAAAGHAGCGGRPLSAEVGQRAGPQPGHRSGGSGR